MLIAQTTGREDLDVVEATLHNRRSFVAACALDQLDQAIGPEELVQVVADFDQAVGVGAQGVAGADVRFGRPPIPP